MFYYSNDEFKSMIGLICVPVDVYQITVNNKRFKLWNNICNAYYKDVICSMEPKIMFFFNGGIESLICKIANSF